MALITAKIDGVNGYIKSGHLELEITGKRLNDFKSMSPEDQMEYIADEGMFIIDSSDWDYDEIKSITIQE